VNVAQKPTELAITLAVLSCDSPQDDWAYSSQVRQGLVLLGFNVSQQQVSAWLRPMCEVDAPWLERKRSFGDWRYRVTRYGANDVENKLLRVRVLRDG
jgi:hypothetical protein